MQVRTAVVRHLATYSQASVYSFIYYYARWQPDIQSNIYKQ